LKNKPRSEFLYSNEKTYPSRDKASVLLIDDPQETFDTCHSIKNRKHMFVIKHYELVIIIDRGFIHTKNA